jgi:hypothetical protein
VFASAAPPDALGPATWSLCFLSAPPTAPPALQGKTLSLICGALHWLEDARQREAATAAAAPSSAAADEPAWLHERAAAVATSPALVHPWLRRSAAQRPRATAAAVLSLGGAVASAVGRSVRHASHPGALAAAGAAALLDADEAEFVLPAVEEDGEGGAAARRRRGGGSSDEGDSADEDERREGVRGAGCQSPRGQPLWDLESRAP